ncbi:Talin-1, partial [Kappamyces sp. JEL0680]
MKDLVPPEYHKNKDVEKALYKEHSILQGTSELNAKFRYVQLIRSLKSYGTTFFLVHEPADKAAKKKAQNMLLGITKSTVVRMDIETKKIVSEWKLTQLRNWTFSAKTFTLDLGDHEQKYYQVETKEGDEITRLLSGYVEILVKKRNLLSIKPVEVQMEEQAVIEDYVKPGQSKNVAVVTNTSSAKQAKMISSPAGARPESFVGSRESRVKPAIAQDLDVVENQELILKLIKTGIETLDGFLRDIQSPMALPSTSNDPGAQQWREDTAIINSESLATHIAGLLTATSAMLLHANGDVDKMDYEILGSNVSALVASGDHCTQAMRVLAGLTTSDDDQEDLVGAGKALIDATLSLLRELQPV